MKATKRRKVGSSSTKSAVNDSQINKLFRSNVELVISQRINLEKGWYGDSSD